MSKESIALRMRELGLKTLQEWDFYKFMFNNVSFNNKDVDSQSGEKVYAKFARGFAKYQEKNNIWKDPKVELPRDMSFVLFVFGENEVMRGSYHDAIYLGGDTSNDDGGFERYVFVEKDTKEPLNYEDFISKWCYEEDLIKQAGGK